MKLVVNGKGREVSGATVLALISELGLDPKTVVVEHNGVLLRREELERRELREGDKLELVRFVGGAAEETRNC